MNMKARTSGDVRTLGFCSSTFNNNYLVAECYISILLSSNISCRSLFHLISVVKWKHDTELLSKQQHQWKKGTWGGASTLGYWSLLFPSNNNRLVAQCYIEILHSSTLFAASSSTSSQCCLLLSWKSPAQDFLPFTTRLCAINWFNVNFLQQVSYACHTSLEGKLVYKSTTAATTTTITISITTTNTTLLSTLLLCEG